MAPELSGAKSSRAAETVRPKTFFVLQALKAVLPQVIVQGIPSVNRAVINVQENTDSARSGPGGASAPKERWVDVFFFKCFSFHRSSEGARDVCSFVSSWMVASFFCFAVFF